MTVSVAVAVWLFAAAVMVPLPAVVAVKVVRVPLFGENVPRFGVTEPTQSCSCLLARLARTRPRGC